MMKINLLGEASPAAMTGAASSSSTRQTLVFVVALAVAMSIVGFLYLYWNNQVHHEQEALAREQIRQKELAAVQAQNQKYQDQLKQLEERVTMIQQLQSSRQGPVDLMTRLGDTVDATHNLYLLQMNPVGKVIHLRGQSQTVASIARFIRALNQSPRFTNVRLTQYYQNNQYDRTSFDFDLDCVYSPPAEVPSPAGEGPAAGGAAPSGAK